MNVRRKALLAVFGVCLAGALIAAGVALGSRVVRTNAPDQPKNENVQGKGGIKILKCKAQACVHFDDNGTIFSASPSIAYVDNVNPGEYCIGLTSKLHPDDNTVVIGTADYINSPNNMITVEGNGGGTTHCANSHADPNAVQVRTFYNDSGTSTNTNEAAYVIIP